MREDGASDNNSQSTLLKKIDQLPKVGYIDNTDISPDDQETVILASYPRSGNTLLRAYVEKIMGLVTGSDCDIEKKLNKELML